MKKTSSSPNALRKYKSFKEGYRAAKDGMGQYDCPYVLDDIAKQILIKRDRWMRGYEEFAFRKKTTAQMRKARNLKNVISKDGYGTGYYEVIKGGIVKVRDF